MTETAEMSGMTGMTQQALALVESGVLVNGWVVTDLLSGFTVRCDAPDDEVRGDVLLWRGSTVPLTRLELVRELVAEVLDERAADPELTSPNPRTPRVRFPWGVGEPDTDVLVTGEDAVTVAAYLRTVGVRARCADPDGALRLAADLEMARAELAELEGGGPPGFSGVVDAPGIDGAVAPTDTAPVDTAPPDTSGDASVPAAQRAPLAAGAVVLAVVLVVVLVVAGIVAVVAVLGHGGEETAAVASGAPETPVASGAEAGGAVVGGSPASESSRAAATSIPPGDRPFSDPVRHGETTPDPVTDRADIPVNAELVGWTLREATARREIWMSDDPDARILVAATPTPLGTQEELDARMLAGLGDMAGVRVTSRGPVDYEEHSGRSTTRWQVRLIDGHQVSVGCQYRAGTAAATGERLAACDRFTATARVGVARG